MNDLETPLLVVSQASVSQSQTPLVDSLTVLMNFMKTMQDREKASQKRNLDMLEQHRLETEMQLEQQCKEMDLHMEQQQKDMVTMADKTVQNVINQVPLIVQNALLGIGSVMNVTPLQLKVQHHRNLCSCSWRVTQRHKAVDPIFMLNLQG